MVELDKLKKVNALASELKKHNFAETNDEAAKLAEEFYQNKKEEKDTPYQPSYEVPARTQTPFLVPR